VLAGLIFSCFGDAFMVWKTKGYFIHGVAMFAMAQVTAILISVLW